MGNDIEIRVKVANQTGSGLTSVNTSLRALKTSADHAAAGLRTLSTRSAASGQALGRVEAHAQQATRALAELRAASDVRLTARFDGDAAQITATARSMRDLRNDAQRSSTALTSLTTRATAAAAALNSLEQQAQDASRALRTLRGRAAAAAVAMGELRVSTAGAANGLRTFNTRTQTAHTRLDGMADRTRQLRADTDDLDGSMRRLTGTMNGLRGSNGRITVAGNDASNGMDKLRKAALLLSPALIPIAAATVPVIANATAAGVAVGAFGLAIAGQLGAVKGASDAQAKYTAAVLKHGAASKEAAQAESLYLETVENLDPATRKASAALSVFTGQYKSWSKSLAGDTMPVFTKGLAVAGALFPKLTPMVKGASAELDRFMTILAGGINSGGFSAFMDRFSKFSTGVLQKANDGLVHFMRSMSEGAGRNNFTEFMAYVREVGPRVGETLRNLGQALAHLVAAASESGVGILSFVNVLAQLVNAMPTSLLSSLLQFALVMKTVRLAGIGLAAASGGIQGFITSVSAVRTAAAGASGGLGRLSAAFGALSTGAKFGVIGAAVGVLVVGLVQLSKVGKQAPPDVDKLTVSLGRLGATGRTAGEGARLFGKNLSGLYDAIRNISDPTTTDKVQQGLVKVFSLGMADSTPHTDAKKRLDAIDEALTKLVRGGKADIAAAAFEKLQKAYVKGGGNAGDLKKKLDDYRKALDDQKFEAQLAAQSMGVFGEQAQATAAKLDQQKQSADGLRGAIQALNDVNRQGLGGMIGFEAAIDAAAKAAKDNAGALSMTNGVLNLGSEKARNAASALQDLADKTDSAAASARESGSSWETVNGIYSRGRAALIANARAMGLTKTEAAALADQILKIPNKNAKVTMNTEDAKAGLSAFNAALKRTPGARSVTLKTLSSSAEKVLESFGYKVTHLKDGRVRVTAATGGALSAIRNVAGAIASLHSKTVTLTANYRVTGSGAAQVAYSKAGGHQFANAHGGLVRRASGGPVMQHFDGGGYVQGPGTPTSDSILASFASGATARISDSEYVMQAAAVRKYGVKFMDALNSGHLKVAGFARGGKVSKQAKAEAQARNEARGDLSISHFGWMAGWRRDEFANALGHPDSIGSLVSALNQWRSIIQKSTHGGTESRLLKQLDSTGKQLLKYEKQLNTVTKSLEKAKDKLNSLKDAAASLASSVKGNILSSANITRNAGEGPVTVASIMGGLTSSRDKATAFDQALAELKKKGLSSSLIQQIGEAGIEGGGLETAGALLGASGSEIKSLNDLQSQIGKAAEAAGKTTADAVYGAQIKAQTKLVNDLAAQQKKLVTSMDNLTKAMEKAIKKAFGKKASGGIVGAAASGGIRGGRTLVGEYEPELLDLPVGSRVWSGPDTRRKLAQMRAPWASMLTTPRRGPAYTPTPAAGGDGQPIVIQVSIAGRDFGELWVDAGRRAVKARGSIEATLRPPRGR